MPSTAAMTHNKQRNAEQQSPTYGVPIPLHKIITYHVANLLNHKIILLFFETFPSAAIFVSSNKHSKIPLICHLKI
jgi:hypothetical protein